MADIIRPIEPFQLTQGFGGNAAAYKQFGLAGHNGWDLKTKYPDTPKGQRYILSSWVSKFYKQGNEGTKGYGKYFEVIVYLKNTWKLTYAHCYSIESFTTRFEGATMAISDNTGNSTGSHLHLTVKKGQMITGVFQHYDPNNGYFGAVNPQLFFDELREHKKNATIKVEVSASEQTPTNSVAPDVAVTTEPTTPLPTPQEAGTQNSQPQEPIGESPSEVVSNTDDPVLVAGDNSSNSQGSISSPPVYDSGSANTTQPETNQEVPQTRVPLDPIRSVIATFFAWILRQFHRGGDIK